MQFWHERHRACAMTIAAVIGIRWIIHWKWISSMKRLSFVALSTEDDCVECVIDRINSRRWKTVSGFMRSVTWSFGHAFESVFHSRCHWWVEMTQNHRKLTQYHHDRLATAGGRYWKQIKVNQLTQNLVSFFSVKANVCEFVAAGRNVNVVSVQQ